MKTYRELYFRGTEKQLSDFCSQIGKYIKGDWKIENQAERWKDYLFIDYTGINADKARVSIYLGDDLSKGELKVGNIIPLEKNSLNVDEYNAVLMFFYNDIIKPFKENGTELDISEPSDDVFNPLTVISEDALKKLRSFCFLANKSTGSSHPCDQERWFDFIYQTVKDDKTIDYTTLSNFLQDEEYWGERPDGFSGAIHNRAWDEEHAYDLASEYENLSTFLLYCKNEKRIPLL